MEAHERVLGAEGGVELEVAGAGDDISCFGARGGRVVLSAVHLEQSGRRLVYKVQVLYLNYFKRSDFDGSGKVRGLQPYEYFLTNSVAVTGVDIFTAFSKRFVSAERSSRSIEREKFYRTAKTRV